MARNKLFAYLKFNWWKILLILFVLIIFLSITTTLFLASLKFTAMESFSKNQMMAQTGMFLFVGIMQAFITVPLFMLGYYYIFRGGGFAKMFGSISSEKTKVDVRWDEVIGMDEAKRDAKEIVQLLKDKQKLKTIGGANIKGAMLIGPPGCGKTYLAKAIATEADLPFLSAVGSEFVGIIVGLGAMRMKSLFKKARTLAELEGGCIIFIDEIDSFARPRQEEKGFGGQTSQNATVNQFLTELDGIKQKESNIFILAATNVPEEQLDPAIMRSGRFDRKIYLEKPTARERAALIQFYLSKVKYDTNIDMDLLAEKAQWFSPADINNMVREASIIALRNNREIVNMDDIKKALDRVIRSIEKIGGEKILSSKVNVKWDEVIGMESAKKEAWEVVNLLKDRSLLKAIGGKMVKGILMLGPPGCGKTYLAKAIATEAGFPFIARAGSEFIEMFVGVGAKRIRDLFKEARALARAEGGCLIFIDEIDSFGRPRRGDVGYGGPSEYNSTVNQLLTELDGLRQTENNIVVLAATNVAENELDSALMRAGRFDRKIYINRPNLKEREELFEFYLSKVQTDDSVKPDILARKTLWFTPSDIANMVREAGMIALREKRDTITFKDLSQAYDRVSYGEKSNINLSEKERNWTAYHEAGHAIIAYLLHPTDDVIKATIIPHKGFLGFVDPRPREELYAHDKEWYLANIKVDLASYAAENIKFGTTASGVYQDFKNAMSKARQMVWELGMGKSGFVGNWTQPHTQYMPSMSLSEKTKAQLDEDVNDMLQSCVKEVTGIITEKKDLLDYFAQELLKKGELEYDEIQAIFDKFGLKPSVRPPKT